MTEDREWIIELCERKTKPMMWAMDHLDRAESMYRADMRYGSAARVARASFETALAYARKMLTEDEWKSLSKELYNVRESILRGDSVETVRKSIDEVRKKIEVKGFEGFKECMKKGGKL
ncbi:MAG: hypothetical protein QME47_07100 [Candidatus Thermoplasmatota archaeon]|nr:hypothetical protein [Candidatus Thermoplasmatota archaeon]